MKKMVSIFVFSMITSFLFLLIFGTISVKADNSDLTKCNEDISTLNLECYYGSRVATYYTDNKNNPQTLNEIISDYFAYEMSNYNYATASSSGSISDSGFYLPTDVFLADHNYMLSDFVFSKLGEGLFRSTDREQSELDPDPSFLNFGYDNTLPYLYSVVGTENNPGQESANGYLPIVRGENSIIFQDVYDYPAYNKSYAYKTCEKRFIFCTKWSDFKVTNIYNRDNSVPDSFIKTQYEDSYYEYLSPVYSNLDSIQMILPSMSINFNDYLYDYKLNRDLKVGSTTFYSLNNVSGEPVYEDKTGYYYYTGEVNELNKYNHIRRLAPALFTHLVMIYTARVEFYYIPSTASEKNGYIDLKKGYADVEIYVTYTAEEESKYAFLTGVNGFSNAKNNEMNVVANIPYVPVQFNLSMILEPSNWKNVQFTDETINVEMAKIRNFNTENLSGRKIIKGLTEVDDDGILIRAIGATLTFNVNAFFYSNMVSMYTSGIIHYKTNVNLLNFGVSYQIGEREEVNFTDMIHNYIFDRKCSSCSSPIEGPVNQDIFVKIQPNENDIKVYVAEISDNAIIKEFRSRNFDVSTYSSRFMQQSKSNGKPDYELNFSSSSQKLIIVKISSTEYDYYLPFLIDKIAPEIDGSKNYLAYGKYIIVKSKIELESLNYNDLKNLGFIFNDNVTIDNFEVTEHVVTDSKIDKIFLFNLSVSDEAGNIGSNSFKVIVDDMPPNYVKAKIETSSSEEDLSSETSKKITINISLDSELKNDEDLINFANEYLNKKIGNISSLTDLSTISPYDAITEESNDKVSISITRSDDGIYEYNSAGMKGILYKTWIINSADDSESGSWKYERVSNITGRTEIFSIILQEGLNYVAVISVDAVNNLYNQSDIYSETFTIDVEIFAIRVYATQYVDRIVATQDGFALVVRDDLTVYNSSTTSTVITNYVIVDKQSANYVVSNFGNKTTKLTEDIFTYLDTEKYDNTIIGKPISKNELFANKIMYDESYDTYSYYEKIIDYGIGFLEYKNISLCGSVQKLILNDVGEMSNFSSLMLINGLLVDSSYLLVEIKIVDSTNNSEIYRYQQVDFPDSLFGGFSKAKVELENTNIDGSIQNVDNVYSITGNDSSSHFSSNGDMILDYKFNVYKNEIDDKETYRSDDFILYYKVCYETEGSQGKTIYCGSNYRRYNQDGINLGKVNENILYRVYVGTVTAITYDYSSISISKRYNNEDKYSTLTYTNDKVSIENDVNLYADQLKETFYEVYYGKFLYSDSLPQITVEYTTVDEYVENGVNKLKDVDYAGNGEKNFIVKVKLQYLSDVYKKKEYWTKLQVEDIYWFPYYKNSGESVCGNTSRLTCDKSLAFQGWRVEEAARNSNDEYDYSLGLEYYLQFPLSKDIPSQYSVDKFDLVITLSTSDGVKNKGMNLVVDDVIRKQNAEFITINYDQDPPEIEVTSTPKKYDNYYSISIYVKDISSNVKKIRLYYGLYEEATDSKIETLDNGMDPILLDEILVNSKTFSGYSQRLNQKGIYTVVAEDEVGLVSTLTFEVVQVEGGVMYSPDLGDVNQDNDSQTSYLLFIVVIICVIGVMLMVGGPTLLSLVGLGGGLTITKSEKFKKVAKKLPGKYGKAAQTISTVANKVPNKEGKQQQDEKPPIDENGDQDNQPKGEE